eukprot:gene28565-50435_t
MTFLRGSLLECSMMTFLVMVLMHPAWAWSRVGEITLVIGQSEIERSTGPNLAPAKGDAIQQGDVIKTSAS